MQLYAGLDLHSTNTYIGILDQEFNRVFKKRVPNKLDLILQTLKPFGITAFLVVPKPLLISRKHNFRPNN
jgi:hypothetical protein